MKKSILVLFLVPFFMSSPAHAMGHSKPAPIPTSSAPTVASLQAALAEAQATIQNLENGQCLAVANANQLAACDQAKGGTASACAALDDTDLAYAISLGIGSCSVTVTPQTVYLSYGYDTVYIFSLMSNGAQYGESITSGNPSGEVPGSSYLDQAPVLTLVRQAITAGTCF